VCQINDNYLVLADCGEPDGRIGLDLRGWNENGVMAGVDRAQAPKGEAKAAVGVQAQCYVSVN